MLHVVLCRPEIPQNTGTLIRTAACLGFTLHVIHPLGFRLNESKIKRAHMDYFRTDLFKAHDSFSDFLDWHHIHATSSRLIALTPQAPNPMHTFSFQKNDIFLLGAESSGLSEAERQSAHHCLKISMTKSVRSLNVAIAATLVVGKALSDAMLWPPY